MVRTTIGKDPLKSRHVPNRLIIRPLYNAAWAPVERLLESPMYARMTAGLFSILTLMREDILFLVLVCLFVANIWDTVLGRMAAQKRNEKIDAFLARAGLLTKITGFVMVLLIRMIEHWAQEQGVKGLEVTHGAIAAGFTMTLLLMEMESIEGHRVTLGARPIPAFSAFIRWMRRMEARLLVATNTPAPPPPPPEPQAGPYE